MVRFGMRERERAGEVDKAPIELARTAYRRHGVRAKIKQSINRGLRPNAIEEKSDHLLDVKGRSGESL